MTENILHSIEFGSHSVRERQFVRATYGWMMFGLILSAIGAAWVVNSKAMQRNVLESPATAVGLVFVEFVIVAILAPLVDRMPRSLAALLFYAHSALNGAVLGGAALALFSANMFYAFSVAALTYGVMSAWAFLTRDDLTSRRSFFVMASFGTLLAAWANIFLWSDPRTFAVTVAGLLFSIVMTVWETDRLKRLSVEHGGSAFSASVGALALYFSFVNVIGFAIALIQAARGRSKSAAMLH